MNKASEAILSCLAEKGISQRQLAASMGEDVRNLNQQLNRRNDMKVERFIDVLEHAGYRVEIVDNGGIRKVSSVFASQIVETKEPKGLFYECKDGAITGIANTAGEALCKGFSNKEECFKWLRGEM